MDEQRFNDLRGTPEDGDRERNGLEKRFETNTTDSDAREIEADGRLRHDVALGCCREGEGGARLRTASPSYRRLVHRISNNARSGGESTTLAAWARASPGEVSLP